MNDCYAEAAAVLREYGIDATSVAPLGTGLINLTLRVDTAGGSSYVLQRLHPVFPAAVNESLHVVTSHLAAKGLLTPRLVPTTDGRLAVLRRGTLWRVLTFVEGRCFDRVPDADVAREAGALLGRFHVALLDLRHEFTARRAVHNLEHHLETLRATLQLNGAHRLFHEAHEVAREIFALAGAIPGYWSICDRVVHGDPKISNLLFAHDTPRALCLIDLDTLARLPLVAELGDAFRSWCNPRGEDVTDGEFSLPLLVAAVAGYAPPARGFIRDNEWQSIVPAIEAVLVELAARFCADALREEYFGWDAQRFASRGEHNLVRATGQLSVLRSLMSQRAEAVAVVAQAFRDAH